MLFCSFIQILSVTFFFSFTVNILYYYGIMQWVVKKIGWLLQVTVGTTAAESTNAAANIFLGQVTQFLPYYSITIVQFYYSDIGTINWLVVHQTLIKTLRVCNINQWMIIIYNNELLIEFMPLSLNLNLNRCTVDRLFRHLVHIDRLRFVDIDWCDCKWNEWLTNWIDGCLDRSSVDNQTLPSNDDQIGIACCYDRWICNHRR